MKRPACQVDHPMQRQRWRFRQIGTQPRATHYWLSQEVPFSELVHTAAESAERKPPPWRKWIVLLAAPTMSDRPRPPLPEWAPHEAVWIGFPSDPDLWLADLKPAEQEIAAFAQAIPPGGKGENVRLVAAPGGPAEAAQRLGPFAGT